MQQLQGTHLVLELVEKNARPPMPVREAVEVEKRLTLFTVNALGTVVSQVLAWSERQQIYYNRTYLYSTATAQTQHPNVRSVVAKFGLLSGM